MNLIWKHFAPVLAAIIIAVLPAPDGLPQHLGWADWFMAAAPAGLLLLVAVPVLTYRLYPPKVKHGTEVPRAGAQEMIKLRAITSREITLAVLVAIVLLLWIFGGAYINATTAALVVISLMLLTNVVTWDDITQYSAAWNTLAWFATLVALADGRSRVGFVKWFAEGVASHMSGFTPLNATLLLLIIHFFAHDEFASITAHATAMLPVLPAVGSRNEHAPSGATPLSPTRHHGHHYPLWHRPEPGVLRRLPALGGLLAPRRCRWNHFLRRFHGQFPCPGCWLGVSRARQHKKK
jgi:L-tartrate/succinate antiporter